MKRDARTNAIVFFSGLACVSAATLILVNSDSELKTRAQRQVSRLLDATGKMIGAIGALADHLDTSSTSQQKAENIEEQWEKVTQAMNH